MGLASLGSNLGDGNFSAAAADALGVIADIGAATVPGVPGVAGLGIKAARIGDKGVDATKKATGSVADANRAQSRAKGIPDSQIGPSGKPKVHTVQHSTKKGAEESAQRQMPEDGKVRFDAHPKDGQKPHYQAEDAKGENVKPVVHHCPPSKRC